MQITAGKKKAVNKFLTPENKKPRQAEPDMDEPCLSPVRCDSGDQFQRVLTMRSDSYLSSEKKTKDKYTDRLKGQLALISSQDFLNYTDQRRMLPAAPSGWEKKLKKNLPGN